MSRNDVQNVVELKKHLRRWLRWPKQLHEVGRGEIGNGQSLSEIRRGTGRKQFKELSMSCVEAVLGSGRSGQGYDILRRARVSQTHEGNIVSWQLISHSPFFVRVCFCLFLVGQGVRVAREPEPSEYSRSALAWFPL